MKKKINILIAIVCISFTQALQYGVSPVLGHPVRVGLAQRRLLGRAQRRVGEQPTVRQVICSEAASIMTRVVGTGCALSALVAAFTAHAPNRLNAVAAACAIVSADGLDRGCSGGTLAEGPAGRAGGGRIDQQAVISGDTGSPAAGSESEDFAVSRGGWFTG